MFHRQKLTRANLISSNLQVQYHETFSDPNKVTQLIRIIIIIIIIFDHANSAINQREVVSLSSVYAYAYKSVKIKTFIFFPTFLSKPNSIHTFQKP